MVTLIKKVVRIGNGYGILIPKVLFDCEVFKAEDYLKLSIEKIDAPDKGPLVSWIVRFFDFMECELGGGLDEVC